MHMQKSHFNFFSCCLLILLAGCTTPEAQQASDTTAEEFSEVTDTTLESGKTDTAATTEGAEGQPSVESAASVEGAAPATENTPAADGSTDTAANGPQGSTPDAQVPANTETAPAPSSVDNPSAPATAEAPAAEDSQGLAATDGKTVETATPPAEVSAAEAPAMGAPATDATATAAAPAAAAGEVAAESEKTETEQAATEEKNNTTASASPSIAATSAAAESSTAADMTRQERTRRYHQSDRLFGTSRMQLGLNHPTFNENQKGYDSLYGKPKDYPSFAIDWFPLDWWVNPGLSINIGGYAVTGQAAVKTTDGSIVPDPNSQTRLLFIPIQGSFKVEMTPFRQKWLVFDGWIGYEYGWWQETTSVAGSIRPYGLMMADSGSTTTTTTTPTPTSKGVKSATVFGGSANLLLNWLDERTVRSMVDSMGLSHVYLTAFFETVKTMNPSGLTFGRNIYGLGFTFETVK